jgi:hypothetical protein
VSRGASNRVRLDMPYICSDCAKERGGVAPEGHICTCHTGECPYCGDIKDLRGTNDYIWPGSKDISSWD